MLSLAGATGLDPVARRRVRRTSARARPWLLPVAVLVAAVVVPLRLTTPEPTVVAVVLPQVPAGRVLVAVTPADPAVLALAVPGTAVDVYAAPPVGLDPDVQRPARLVADGAMVVDPAQDDPGTGAGGPLDPAGVLPAGPSTGAAVTLAVTDAEAADLASHPGGGLTLAVRAPTGGGPGPPPGGTGR